MTWETVPLGTLATLNPRGQSSNVAATFLGMADLGEDGKTTLGTQLAPEELKPGYTPFENGDLLVAKITPCFENGKIGQVSIPTKHGWGSTEFHVVRPDVAHVDRRYLLHFLRSPAVRAIGQMRMTGSAGQRRVPVEFLRQLAVPLPPLPEQRRIATILDEGEALQQNAAIERRRLNEAVDLRVAGVLDDTSERRAFGELLSEQMRNGISPSRTGETVADVLTLSAITRGKFDPEARKTDTFTSPHATDKLVTAGLHLICRGNGNPELVGAMALSPTTLEGVAFPDTMIAMRPSTVISSASLLAAWRHDSVREQIRRGARTTNGTYKVNQQMLAAVLVPVPTPRNQATIDALEAERTEADSLASLRIAKLNALFASLQNRAFHGSL